MKKLLASEVLPDLEAGIAAEIGALRGDGVEPALAVILVGGNPESQAYVGRKRQMAEKLGILSVERNLPAEISQREMEAEINRLNGDPDIHGVLCQLPLPGHLDGGRIAGLIDPLKDVDCFHPYNFGLLARGTPRFVPCTAAGILAILAHYRIALSGRQVAVIGRSNIVGRPLSLLLSQKGHDATVTLCHSRTADVSLIAGRADILVAAIGSPEWVGPEMIAEGAVVIDVGVNRVDDPSRPRGYRLCGDVDFEAASARASAITPVPGGVGPLTVVMLMRNTVLAARLQSGPMNRRP
ncbi:MAG: bifunctional 5,10-methylenetetrahydrofolate dehydrogenase/5,10-methenyltetrahydrofolate cyclohydrolase [bacterium]